MSNVLYDYTDENFSDMDTLTSTRFMDSEPAYYPDSESRQKMIAGQYVGLSYEGLK